MKDTIYFKQANLVLDVLPIIDKNKRFALKGGTAINFFIRSLPRLSVDIDLTYLPLEDHNTTLQNINDALESIAKQIQDKFKNVLVSQKRQKGNDLCYGLIVNLESVQIKIEPNLIIRGSVFHVNTARLVQKAQDLFEKDVKIQSLSLADLYGGKICAALDRQHPRDLFDIKLLYENEGMTEEIRQAFIFYLISSNRPMIELLNPNEIDIDKIFELEFGGMTFDKVSLAELKSTRKRLLENIRKSLQDKERRFLLSVKSGNPDWGLFPIKRVNKFPSVQWKIQNIKRMSSEKHQDAYNRLKEFLEL